MLVDVVSLAGGLDVKGVGQHADGILNGQAGGHLDLPLAGLAVGGDGLDLGVGDVLEQDGADGLAALIVLLLEAVGARDAAAVLLQFHKVETRNHAQQLDAEQLPAHALHVAGGVIGQAALVVLLEHEFHLAVVHQVVDEAGGQ